MNKKSVRWGLMSTARINERLIPALHASSRSELVAIASRSREKAEGYARDRGIPRVFGGYQEMLDHPGIDAVYISLPNDQHAEWSVRAAEAGKHILCEKPLAISPAEVDRMIEAAQRGGVVMQEAAMYRFHVQTQTVQRLVAEAAIGEIRFIQCSFGFTLSRVLDIRLDPDAGGGALWDIGSYPVSFIRSTLRTEPVEVAAWQTESDRGVDLSLAGQMRFASGTLAQFTCSFQTLTHWHASITGSEGSIHLDQPWLNVVDTTGHLTITRKKTGGKAAFGDSTDFLTETITYEHCNAYADQVAGMEACILDGTPPVISLTDSRANVATIVALYTAAREGRAVRPES
ncbi:MAG: Gfo/Idh/MocA family oxidoreductase [candidate division Zixibacteria bacterium]|nr:Gfo/Idh/MocA family oxidoreductase [candidate division Zixibacteria bacterium]